MLFEWSSLEHVDPSEAFLPLNPGQAGSGYNSSDAWDYFHINSVDKDDEGNYLISARDANAAYKIDGRTSKILWQLSGKSTDFKLGEGVEFAFQHHARYLSRSEDGKKEVISIYDNSAHGTENGRGGEVHFNATSAGKIIEVDTENWTATLVQGFYPPDDLLSKSQGSTQVQPNGNVLVNWGSEGAITEYKPNGEPIFHFYMDSGSLGEGVENYRGFRYNWTGIPHEAPAVVALKDEDEGQTNIYVSWNGDTETKHWRFYEIYANGKREHLGTAERKSFETVLTVERTGIQNVQVVALGAEGEKLVESSVVKPDILIQEYKASESVKGSKGKSSKGNKSSTKIEKPCGEGFMGWLMFKGQKIIRPEDL